LYRNATRDKEAGYQGGTAWKQLVFLIVKEYDMFITYIQEAP